MIRNMQCSASFAPYLASYCQTTYDSLMKWIVFITTLLLSIISHAQDKGYALSGGISLGIYEGGVFYSNISKHRSTIAADAKVIFGTSAGSINGLLGLFEICGFRKTDRESSLFWKMWIPNGLDQLEAKDPKELSLLSRKSSEALFPELRERWKEGFREECDLHYGVAVSRKAPYVEEVKEGLEIIRQAEFFTVRIKGQGRGKPPIVENRKFSDLNTYRSTLPVGESSEKDIEILLGLIQASSAFPAAFEAYPIPFCYHKPGEVLKKCHSGNAKTELFIDGGLYHNGPVGFAYETLEQTARSKNYQLFYINASAPLISQKDQPPPKKEVTNDVIGDFHDVFKNLIVQARKFELVKSLETNPEIVKHLQVNLKHLPLASDPLYAFNGFLEEDFRKADFYAGMIDGEGAFPDDQEYKCFHANALKKSECDLDVNLDILIDLANYRKKEKIYEGDFDRIYSFLEEKQFHFKDLKLKKSQSKYGRVYVKDRLTKLVKRFAEKQPQKRRNKMKHFIRPSLNYLQYTPLKDFWYGSYGTSAEVGYSKIVPENYLQSSSFRFNSTLMVNGFSNFFSRAQDVWAITPLIGFEFEPVKLNGPVLQWRAGARVGYVFSPRDDLGRGECDAELLDEYSGACSGSTLHLTLSLSVLERLRFQVVYIPFVNNSINVDEKPEVLMQLGFQFGESF